MKLVAIIILFTLTACAAGEPLPAITGAWFPLNQDRWQPSDAELQHIKELPEK